MASILIKLDKRRMNSAGKYPVKLIIFNNQTNAALSINYYLPENAWAGDGLQRPVKHSYLCAKSINDRIEKYYLDMRKKLIELEENGKIKSMTASDIKKYLTADIEGNKDLISFSVFGKSFAELCRKPKTKESYLYTIKTVDEFVGDSLTFTEITKQFLVKLDGYFDKKKLKINTKSIHFRNIRAIFNWAIDEEIIGQDAYPFRNFKIRKETKDKVSLSAEEVKSLYEFEFETKTLAVARDFWMLSFFLCGINPIDLFYLRKPGKNGIVSFVRSKIEHETSNEVKLKIQPEAELIIDRYKADEGSEYLLIFENRYNSYGIFKSFISKKIREIANITGFTGLTLYWARYSWATIADGLDISEKTISKGLGHTDTTMAGKSYIAFDWAKVDRANRKVLDYVLGDNLESV